MIFVKVIRKIKNTLTNKPLSRDPQTRKLIDHEVSLLNTGLNTEKRDQRIIASLTTFGERIHTVHWTVKSLLLQEVKADKIVLYIDKDKYNYDTLPTELTSLQSLGLEIRFVKDVRSYTKLVPALKEFPTDDIVTFDDDIVYPGWLLGHLYDEHQKHPNDIICARGHGVQINQGNFEQYSKWKWCVPYGYSGPIIQTGVGGVFYPQGSLHQQATDDSLFLELAPHADDLWFWSMAIMKGTNVRKSQRSFELKYIEEEDAGLNVYNVANNGNDRQLAKINQHFKLGTRLNQRQPVMS